MLFVSLPSTDRSLGVGLCPNIPVNMGGSRSDPAMSDPMPITDPAAEINAD